MRLYSVPWTYLQRGVLLLVLPALSVGCEKAAGLFGRVPLPDFGPPIPVSVRMDFDPSLSDAGAQYLDSCNHPREVRIGPVLEDTLLQAAHQTFKTVSLPGPGPAQTKPDVEVHVSLLQPRLTIKNDNVYDREPALLALDAVATFRDSSGKLLRELPLQVSRQERLLVEPTQQRCAYASLDKFVADTSVVLSSKFIREARALLAPETLTAAEGEAPSPPASLAVTPGATLSFKATILDENGNLILEGGERVRLRVDVVNSGTARAQGVSVTLAGTPAVVTQFPATTLPVGALQPGESRSVEFAATLSQSVQAQRAELLVSITEASGGAAPAAQTIVAAMRPGGQVAGGGLMADRFDDVDQVPAASEGFLRPEAFLVAVGIGAYRDGRNHTRKYAARDAELVAAHFRSLGGVPTSNALVLQDRKAVLPGIEEALLDWLPPRVKRESVVIVYFAGQAVVSPSGETYLVPYDGSRNSVSRLYPLNDLHAALSRLRTQLTLLIFDGGVSQVGRDTRAQTPQWHVGGGGIVHLIGTTGLHNALESDKLRHGLFTYYLLRGLRGEADANHNEEVTLGELTAFLRDSVPAAAKSQFRQEQRPQVFPAMPSTSKLAGFTLTKPTASQMSQNR